MLLSELVQDVRVKYVAYLESSMSMAPPPATTESFCIARLRRSRTKYFPHNACRSKSPDDHDGVVQGPLGLLHELLGAPYAG